MLRERHTQFKKTQELTQEATTHPRRPRLRDYHVRSCQRCQAGSAAPAAALATPAPPRVVRRLRFWAGYPVLIHAGTGLPERETSPQRVAQRVPGRAEAEARHERRWRRAAATRENDDDADDDGAPALLVVAAQCSPGDAFQPATCAIDAAPSTSIIEGAMHAGTD